MNIADIRTDYTLGGLQENDLLPNPLAQFKKWFDEAIAAQIPEANGMTLCTVDKENRPHARIVLLKGIDTGFTFFTNYNSDKGSQIVDNQNVALNFWWIALERQVRIEGTVEKVSSEESDAYFASRPRGSQIGAWVSNQSEVIMERNALTQKITTLEQQFTDKSIPRPPHWGGYRVVPSRIEFWQGRASRLHDRLRYSLQDGFWNIERLSP